MPIKLNDLPTDHRDLRIPAGRWHVYLTNNLTERLGPANFREGATAKPIAGLDLRRLVCALGDRILYVERVDDGLVLGDKPNPDAVYLERIAALRSKLIDAGIDTPNDEPDDVVLAKLREALDEDNERRVEEGDEPMTIDDVLDQIAEDVESSVEAAGKSEPDAPTDPAPAPAENGPESPSEPEMTESPDDDAQAPHGAASADDEPVDVLDRLDTLTKNELKAVARAENVVDLVDLRLGPAKLAEQIREAVALRRQAVGG